MANHVSKERLYLTKDGDRVVPEGDPEAATLFVAAGLEVSAEDVEKYKLSKYMAEAKAVEAPKANKAVKPAENK